MDNPFKLSGKVALVTGGSRGIGEHICRVFSAAGATVHIIDVDEENGLALANELSRHGGSARFHRIDVRDQKSLQAECRDIFDSHGSLDILVANAGVSQIGRLDQTNESDLDLIYAINVKGVYNAMYACVPYMQKQRAGVIVNLASIASTIGLPDRFGYSMSKGAVLSMTMTVARDYLKDNIRCNCIAPARVHTPFVDHYLKTNYPGKEEEMFEKLAKTQPIGRMGTPEEIAYLVLYLCSDKAAFITGSNIPIDGGFITLNT